MPYGLHLEPAHEHIGDPVTPDTFKDLLGKKAQYPELLDFFDQEEHDLGTQKLIEKYGPLLVPGAGAALTHGIIHTGWAIDAARRVEELQAGSRWMLVEGTL